MTSTAAEVHDSSSPDHNSNQQNNRPIAMDHTANSYIAVTLSSNSPYFSAPASLTAWHPSLTYEGPVGALDDTHLYSVPHGDGDGALSERDDVLGVLEARGPSGGIVHFELQQLRQRARRDEL